MSESNSQLRTGAFMSYVAISFNIIAGLIYTPWMIKQIGKSDYGLYVLVTSFLSYFLLDFGLGSAIARFISKYRLEKDDTKINELLGVTTKFYLFLNLIILTCLIVAYFLISYVFIELNSFELEKFRVIYCIAGLFSILSFPFMPIDGVLIAYERFFILKFSDLIGKVGLIGLMIVALVLGYKLYALVFINALIGVLVILIKLIYISKNTSIRISFKFKSRALLKELFTFSIWISVIGIAQRLLINIVPTILGRYSGTTQIALFSVGIIIEGYTWTFAHALNGLFLPMVSRINMEENNRNEITALMIKVGRIQLIIMGILIIGIITLGKEFIVLWMGQEFEQSYFVVLLMIIPGIITLTQEIAYTYLFVVNELKYRAILFISASILSMTVGIVLAPHYGAIGCAIGIFIATMLCHVLGMNYVYWKILKLDIPRFFKECYLTLLLPLISIGIIGFVINTYLPASNLVEFMAKSALLALTYFTMVWFWAMKKHEKEMFVGIASKILLVIKKNR